jgi:hypothetical protein
MTICGADSQSAAPALLPALWVETSLDPAGRSACATTLTPGDACDWF